MDERWFFDRTGYAASIDDMDRVNCYQAGKPGHHYCGVCPECNKPRFICGHGLFPEREVRTGPYHDREIRQDIPREP